MKIICPKCDHRHEKNSPCVELSQKEIEAELNSIIPALKNGIPLTVAYRIILNYIKLLRRENDDLTEQLRRNSKNDL